MKKHSIFTLLLVLLVIGFVGVAIIFALALVLGSRQGMLIDFSNINFANVGVVVFAGFLVMMFIFIAAFIIIAKIGFDKITDFIKNQNEPANKKSSTF